MPYLYQYPQTQTVDIYLRFHNFSPENTKTLYNNYWSFELIKPLDRPLAMATSNNCICIHTCPSVRPDSETGQLDHWWPFSCLVYLTSMISQLKFTRYLFRNKFFRVFNYRGGTRGLNNTSRTRHAFHKWSTRPNPQ